MRGGQGVWVSPCRRGWCGLCFCVYISPTLDGERCTGDRRIDVGNSRFG